MKNGKDDLIVNKVTVQTEDLNGKQAEYDCKGYTLTGRVKTCGVSSEDLESCLRICMRAGHPSWIVLLSL